MFVWIGVWIAIFVFGTRIADALRLRAEESILRKLSVPEAHAYYEVLKRRARRTKALRAVTLASLLLVMMAARRHLIHVEARPVAAPVPGSSARAVDSGASAEAPALTTSLARERAEEAVRKHLPAGIGARLETVSSDAAHPWIFDFSAGPERLRVYVTGAGKVEVHRRLGHLDRPPAFAR